jgi:DNA-binding CsgD family transcriptional regulator
MLVARAPGARSSEPDNLLDTQLDSAAALLAAMAIATDYGSATNVLEAAGVQVAVAEELDGFSDDRAQLIAEAIRDDRAREILALGYLAGSVGRRRRRHTLQDPTSFMMDHDLMVRAAHGESILRLPWFEEELFLGRELPAISEVPRDIRHMAVRSYRAALAGERNRYSFTSYGHSYSVDAVPLRDPSGRVHSVLAVAVPQGRYQSAAAAYERAAVRMERSAAMAEERAHRYRREGHALAAQREDERAERARHAATRAWKSARVAWSPAVGHPREVPPSLSPRELDVLSLASHGLSYFEIAEELVVSPATVKTHLANIYTKLGVSDKAAAVAAALRRGLID